MTSTDFASFPHAHTHSLVAAIKSEVFRRNDFEIILVLWHMQTIYCETVHFKGIKFELGLRRVRRLCGSCSVLRAPAVAIQAPRRVPLGPRCYACHSAVPEP